MKNIPTFLPALLSLCVCMLCFSCQQGNQIPVGEGYLEVDGGKIWYRVVGEGDKTPILVLHGGPGIPSYYLKPLAELGADRKVIFFDQLGCGRSDTITDPDLMTMEHYVAEVRSVVKHFKLVDYYLFGHSWGTMLGTDFYLQHPQGIRALILSSPSLSIPLWIKDANILVATLADSLQQAIRVNEQNKTYDAPEYQHAVGVFYQSYLSRRQPWSADLDSSFMQAGINVYTYMCGPSEFSITGTLRKYDRTNRLGEIRVPTLFTTGEFDEARPSTVKYYQSLVPGAKLEIIKGSGHLTSQDNPEQSNKVVMDFLRDIESTK